MIVETRQNFDEWFCFQRSSNPSFLNTVSFRASDGLGANSKIQLTAYDVREPLSQTATPLGTACVTLGTLQECERLRIPIKSYSGCTVGFLSMFVWALEREDQSTPSTESTPCRTVNVDQSAVRSQSYCFLLSLYFEKKRNSCCYSWYSFCYTRNEHLLDIQHCRLKKTKNT